MVQENQHFSWREEQPDSGDIATQNYKIGALKQYFDFKENFT